MILIVSCNTLHWSAIVVQDIKKRHIKEQGGQREAVLLERRERWELVNSSCNLNRILIVQQLVRSLVQSEILLQVALRIH